MSDLGYPDLQDEAFVFEALLGYGMFSKKLPPCFSSKELLDYGEWNAFPKKPSSHAYIEYRSTKYNCVPRQFAVPHPESYFHLCNFIRNHWLEINEQIGLPEKKFNFCHVRKIKGKNYIFEMNYSGADKWHQEELALDYALNCKYVASADISTFFPSVYTHAIPWAIKGKEWSKRHQCNSWNKKKTKGVACKFNGKEPCPHDEKQLWLNDLDTMSRSIKDLETNGVLIGPHTSNIVSELILTRVDRSLQNAGFNRVIRHIDDYVFYAETEVEAIRFITQLTLELKKYELSLNSKKTNIKTYQDFMANLWIGRLHQFTFPPNNPIGFTSVNSYIDFALKISIDNQDFSALNYAIKVVSEKELSPRAKRLYIKKICQISLGQPYLIPIIEKYVFKFANDYKFLKEYLKFLLSRAVLNGETDSLAYAFYFAIKYNILIEFDDYGKVIELNDCMSMLLAFKYCEKNKLSIKNFRLKSDEILKLPDRDQDKYWLYQYEVLPKSKLKGFLRKLKDADISFFDGSGF